MKQGGFQILAFISFFISLAGCDTLDNWTKEEMLTSPHNDTNTDSNTRGTGDSATHTTTDSATSGDTDSSIGSNGVVLNLSFENGETFKDKITITVPAAYDTDSFIANDCTFEIETAPDTAQGVDTATAIEGETDSDCHLTQYYDNNTLADIDGHTALKIHTDTYQYIGNDKAPRQEVQFMLDVPGVDMSGQDYTASFDIYLPKETYSQKCGIQFSLYEVQNYTPIYSDLFTVPLANKWTHIQGAIQMEDFGGSISFSKFQKNPDQWIFDAFRIQLLCENTVQGNPILYYLDNITVASNTDH